MDDGIHLKVAGARDMVFFGVCVWTMLFMGSICYLYQLDFFFTKNHVPVKIRVHHRTKMPIFGNSMTSPFRALRAYGNCAYRYYSPLALTVLYRKGRELNIQRRRIVRWVLLAFLLSTIARWGHSGGRKTLLSSASAA